MLVLSRSKDEVVRIGDSISIKVLKVQGNTVRLGIVAPAQVHVIRGELSTLEDPGPGAPPPRMGPWMPAAELPPPAATRPLSRFRPQRPSPPAVPDSSAL